MILPPLTKLYLLLSYSGLLAENFCLNASLFSFNAQVEKRNRFSIAQTPQTFFGKTFSLNGSLAFELPLQFQLTISSLPLTFLSFYWVLYWTYVCWLRGKLTFFDLNSSKIT